MSDLKVDFLLVGGGLASARAAETLRREGATGTIMMLCAEKTLPYHRPALSKRYLLGLADESQILVHPSRYYVEQEIDVRLSTYAVSVDTALQQVRTSSGLEIGYGKLLLATGAAPRPLDVPGAALGGIHTLRGQSDCDAIRLRASTAKRAVVVGGSFLGMEVAISLLELGLEVTIIEAGDRVMRHLESATLSAFFLQYAQQRGATVMLDDPVTAFGGEGQISEVHTRSGQRIRCDLAIVSTGVEADTRFLADSGIKLEDGRIVVDEQLRTSVPNVFAAGDATTFYDPIFLRQRHIEHWDNAVKQGRLAAENMLDLKVRYDQVSYFFCEIGDIAFNMLGAPEEGTEHVSRGSLEDRSFALFYLNGNIPRAYFSLGRDAGETRVAEELIRYRTNLRCQKENLANSDFTLDLLPPQTVLILQGGGALGAFESGVVRALEEEGVFPDIVAGVSIGALNGAIVASNPKNAAGALEAFWSELEVRSSPFLPEPVRQAVTSMQILQFGVPKFFVPKWMPTPGTPWTAPWNWISFYDTSPMRELISRYVDFGALRKSPVRLLVGAVNVLSAELEIFDSYVDELTADHILASGSLPPGFAWTFVDGKPYWDGGTVSNSPLDLVIDRCGPDGKRAFVVDLYSGQKPLPSNMMEIMARRDEIVYSERVRSDLRVRELIDAYRGLIDTILHELEPAARERIRHRPRYIQLMGDGTQMNITRFVRKGHPGEPSSRDYDFSDVAIRANQAEGYDLVKRTLARVTHQAAPLPEPEHASDSEPLDATDSIEK